MPECAHALCDREAVALVVLPVDDYRRYCEAHTAQATEARELAGRVVQEVADDGD